MHAQQPPVVTAWYTNLTGQLFKVKMVSYDSEGELDRIVTEYLDGERQIISRHDWLCLKLMKHAAMKSVGEATAEEA